MKTIRDDMNLREAEQVLSDLAAKKEAVDQELARLSAKQSSNAVLEPEDPVRKALAMEPGVPQPDKDSHHARSERHKVLSEQSAQLERAIQRQGQVVRVARENAERRMFASDSGAPYRAAVDEIIRAVESLIAANELVAAEQKKLSQCGIHSYTDARFPFYGLWEQVPAWRKELLELKRQIDRAVKANVQEEISA
ncbi:hypothetical protein [Lysobacter sp. Root494]|uniref:hypothetical protein n=1 Tax=Lysobacter sp. Root494 TaxID=1736549 RepID=UPI0006F2E46A|nr:hypothetical protein [Lysobacter sp. Root494]KQY51191.1 hypothetical protein ASD14_10330 [Lysobacter sp. Root494]